MKRAGCSFSMRPMMPVGLGATATASSSDSSSDKLLKAAAGLPSPRYTPMAANVAKAMTVGWQHGCWLVGGRRPTRLMRLEDPSDTAATKHRQSALPRLRPEQPQPRAHVVSR